MPLELDRPTSPYRIDAISQGSGRAGKLAANSAEAPSSAARGIKPISSVPATEAPSSPARALTRFEHLLWRSAFIVGEIHGYLAVFRLESLSPSAFTQAKPPEDSRISLAIRFAIETSGVASSML